jgi:hypothetical protein
MFKTSAHLRRFLLGVCIDSSLLLSAIVGVLLAHHWLKQVPAEHQAVLFTALALGTLGGLLLTAAGCVVLYAIRCGRAWLRS